MSLVIAEPQPSQPPETVFRGIVIPAANIGEWLFTQPLVPGEPPFVDDQGRLTVRDGNEHGVYTTTSHNVADYAYATPRDDGDALPDSPTFSHRGFDWTRVGLPRVGVLYEIDPRGAPGIREPFIADYLRRHYNNGIEGEEWIADSFPVGSYRIQILRLGEDLLHRAQVFRVGEDPAAALELVRQAVGIRLARLAILSERIGALGEGQWRNEFAIRREIERLQAEIEAADAHQS